MAKQVDVTVRVLEQIRDEVVGLRAEVRETNTRIEETNAKVDVLARRQTETEVRLSTELVAVTSAVNGVRDLLRDRLDQRDRVDDHERRLMALERRSA